MRLVDHIRITIESMVLAAVLFCVITAVAYVPYLTDSDRSSHTEDLGGRGCLKVE